jgi:hypothetical protein
VVIREAMNSSEQKQLVSLFEMGHSGLEAELAWDSVFVSFFRRHRSKLLATLEESGHAL